MKLTFSNRTVISSILVVCTAILVLLFWLIYFREPITDENSPHRTFRLDVSFLPTMNAVLNTLSASCLALGFVAIRRGNRKCHLQMMFSAFIFSTLFLVSYLIYHAFHGDTAFQGEGWIRPLYFFILISHILLSAVVLPLILTTLYFAASGNFTQHPKIARITLPLWMYVSVTGVLVYLMLNRL